MENYSRVSILTDIIAKIWTAQYRLPILDVGDDGFVFDFEFAQLFSFVLFLGQGHLDLLNFVLQLLFLFRHLRVMNGLR